MFRQYGYLNNIKISVHKHSLYLYIFVYSLIYCSNTLQSLLSVSLPSCLSFLNSLFLLMILSINCFLNFLFELFQLPCMLILYSASWLNLFCWGKCGLVGLAGWLVNWLIDCFKKMGSLVAQIYFKFNVVAKVDLELLIFLSPPSMH